jgi:hypothetical protein
MGEGKGKDAGFVVGLGRLAINLWPYPLPLDQTGFLTLTLTVTKGPFSWFEGDVSEIKHYLKDIVFFDPRREPSIIFGRICLFQPIISGF